MERVSSDGVGGAENRADRRLRHATMGWREWILREFVRYMYGLGVLALVVMGPLQMADSWLPRGGAPVLDPAVVGAVAIAFELAVLYLAFIGYQYLWGKEGYVDRAIRKPVDPEKDPDYAPTDDDR